MLNPYRVYNKALSSHHPPAPTDSRATEIPMEVSRSTVVNPNTAVSRSMGANTEETHTKAIPMAATPTKIKATLLRLRTLVT
jgi:hypothetical protein